MKNQAEHTYIGIHDNKLLVKNNMTSEQIYLDPNLLNENASLLLKTGMKVKILYDDNKAVAVTPVDKCASHLVMSVKTNSNQEKIATLQNGLKVMIPSHIEHIQIGSRIPVNILDGTYHEGGNNSSKNMGMVR